MYSNTNFSHIHLASVLECANMSGIFFHFPDMC